MNILLFLREKLEAHSTLCALVACAWIVAGGIAILAPIATPALEDSERSSTTGNRLESTTDGEDLQAFLASTRWGVSLAEINQMNAAAGQRGEMADTDEIGFLGFAEREGATTVLLRLEDGSVEDRQVGDSLPDGRKLATLEDTRLTLSLEESSEEELPLFPDVKNVDRKIDTETSVPEEQKPE